MIFTRIDEEMHLNEINIIPLEGPRVSKLMIDGSGLSVKQKNDCLSFTDL